jgi:hypothetical protein
VVEIQYFLVLHQQAVAAVLDGVEMLGQPLMALPVVPEAVAAQAKTF